MGIEGGTTLAILDKRLDSRILSSARAEFLTHGYQRASLREICKNAGVTTGAIYTRYQGKGGLFEAVIGQTINDIELLFTYDKRPNLREENGRFFLSWLPTADTLMAIVDFLYDHYEDFRLLLCCSAGSKYSDFLHTFIENSTQSVWNHFTKTNDERPIVVDKEELHLMLTTFWTAVFETVVHEFSREKATDYCKVLARFFDWDALHPAL